MDAKTQPQNQKAEKQMPSTKPNDLGKLAISGHIKIFDPWRSYPLADNVIYYGK